MGAIKTLFRATTVRISLAVAFGAIIGLAGCTNSGCPPTCVEHNDCSSQDICITGTDEPGCPSGEGRCYRALPRRWLVSVTTRACLTHDLSDLGCDYSWTVKLETGDRLEVSIPDDETCDWTVTRDELLRQPWLCGTEQVELTPVVDEMP